MELLGSEVSPAAAFSFSDGSRQDFVEIVRAKRSGCLFKYTKGKGNDVSYKQIRLIAAIGASAVVTVGAVAVGINQDRSSLGTDAGSSMSTGVTVTESDAPTALSVTEATPGIRGPAPLPSEEQGLPG
jgi:hypothetical protein